MIIFIYNFIIDLLDLEEMIEDNRNVADLQEIINDKDKLIAKLMEENEKLKLKLNSNLNLLKNVINELRD